MPPNFNFPVIIFLIHKPIKESSLRRSHKFLVKSNSFLIKFQRADKNKRT